MPCAHFDSFRARMQALDFVMAVLLHPLRHGFFKLFPGLTCLFYSTHAGLCGGVNYVLFFILLSSFRVIKLFEKGSVSRHQVKKGRKAAGQVQQKKHLKRKVG